MVRLNEPCYDKSQFEKMGVKHYDIYFDDCSTPECSPTTAPVPPRRSSCFGTRQHAMKLASHSHGVAIPLAVACFLQTSLGG